MYAKKAGFLVLVGTCRLITKNIEKKRIGGCRKLFVGCMVARKNNFLIVFLDFFVINLHVPTRAKKSAFLAYIKPFLKGVRLCTLE